MKPQIFLTVFISLCTILIANAQWQQSALPEGGEIFCMASQGSIIYAGTNGSGLYVSADSGQTWTSVSTFTGTSVYCLYISGNNIFAGASIQATNSAWPACNLYISTDNGQNWTVINNVPNGNVTPITAIVQSGSCLFLSSSGMGIYKSVNNGLNWTAVNNGLGNMDITCITIIDTILVAGHGSSGIYKSSDNGQTWISINTGLTNYHIYSLMAHSNDLYAGTDSGVYKSPDLGQNWYSINNGTNLDSASALSYHDSSIYVGTMKHGIFVSSDDGLSWTQMNNGLDYPNVHTLLFDGTNSYAGTYYHGVYKSTDTAQNWIASNTGIKFKIFNTISVNNQDIYAGTPFGFYYSPDTGQTWEVRNNGITNYNISKIRLAGSDIYVSTAGGKIYKSVNNALNWTCLNEGIPNMTNVTGLVVSGSWIFASDNSHGIFRSSDSGQTWSACNIGLNQLGIKAMEMVNSDLFVSGNGVYKSTNYGSSWTLVNTGLSSGYYVKSFGKLGSSVFAGSQNNFFYHSWNEGQSWIPYNSGLPAPNSYQSLTCFEVYGSYIFAGLQSNGVYLSSDNGQNWTSVSTGMTGSNISSLEINNSSIYASTLNAGIWVRPLTNILSSSLSIGILSPLTFCNGTTGNIDIAVNGGISPFSYLWSNGATTEDIDSLSDGTYYITVTDSLGTSVMSIIKITEESALQLNFDSIYCAGDTIPCSFNLTVTGGTSPYYYIWSNNCTTQNIPQLTGGTYHVTVFDYIGCSETGSMSIDSMPAPGWSYTNTGYNHTILIPVNTTINGNTIQNYNYIGVFYESAGQYYCGGYFEYSANGSAHVIAAWADDLSTVVKDGFSIGEAFTWIVFDPFTDTDYICIPTYNMAFPDQGNFAINGISSLLSLVYTEQQQINLPTGWSIISTYINPTMPNISDVFAQVVSQLIIVKDGNGSVYWPSFGLNNIGNMQTGKGYQLKMLSAQTLTVTGIAVIPETSPVNIPSGWSILGYLRNSPALVITLMSPIVSNIIIVKNGEGHVYWPQFGVDNIVNMIPGQGYQIKVTSACTLTYPPN
ncbi:MAG: hypothetical protein NTW49_12775 [Bacteroidia bacterium]|nr:hypothetical protein [Bacteroidia bacterium]